MKINSFFSLYKKLIYFFLVAIVSLMVGLLPDNNQISWLMRHGSFYLIGILVILWTVWLYLVCRDRFWQILRKHYPALILAVCLTGIIFYNSPPRFKVLADETNLIGVSMMMHHSQEATIPIECLYTADDHRVYTQTSDSKRPFLYPFLVSVLHFVLGYSPSNGFILNFFVSIGALFGTYLTVVLFRPKKYGLLSMIVMAGMPIYTTCSTSAGFELLNMTLVIYCVFLFAFLILNLQLLPWHIEFLLFTMLLLAHCRYESVIFLPVMGLILLPILYRQHFFQNMSYVTVFMPILLLPILWQRKFFMAGQTLLVRSTADILEKVDIGFTIKDFVHNFDDNIFVLMGINAEYGFSAIIFVLALIGMYLLLKRHFRIRHLSAVNSVILVNISVFFSLFLIISAFHWGNFGLASNNRLSLVFLPFLVWAATYCLSQITIFNKKIWSYFIGLLAVLHFVFFIPYGKRDQLMITLNLPYEYQKVSNYLKYTFPDANDTLIVTNLSNLYVIQKYAAIRFSSLHNYLENRSKYKQYKNIIAVHTIIKGKKETSYQRWGEWNIIPKSLTVIPISEEYFIQIESWQVTG